MSEGGFTTEEEEEGGTVGRHRSLERGKERRGADTSEYCKPTHGITAA